MEAPAWLSAGQAAALGRGDQEEEGAVHPAHTGDDRDGARGQESRAGGPPAQPQPDQPVAVILQGQ